MVEKKLKITPLAEEKIKELTNGSRENVLDFFNNIDKYLQERSYKLLFKGEQGNFYYRECKNVYVIFTVDEKHILILDILTKVELEKIGPEES